MNIDRLSQMVSELAGKPRQELPQMPGRLIPRRRVLTKAEILSHADPPERIGAPNALNTGRS